MSTNVGLFAPAALAPAESSGNPGRVLVCPRRRGCVRKAAGANASRMEPGKETNLGKTFVDEDVADVLVLRHEPGLAAVVELDLRDGVRRAEDGVLWRGFDA